MTIQLRDDVTPEEVGAAATAYVLDQTAELLEAVADIAGRFEHAVAAGGWAQLDGVYRGKAHLMPGLTVSGVALPGARGAALFAARAAGITTGTLADQLPATDLTNPTKEHVS